MGEAEDFVPSGVQLEAELDVRIVGANVALTVGRARALEHHVRRDQRHDRVEVVGVPGCAVAVDYLFKGGP